MKLRKSLLTAVSVLLAVAFAAIAPAIAGGKGEPVAGTVGRVVSVGDGKITVNASGAKKTFTTDASTAVVGGKEGATMADIQTGYLVKIIAGATDDAPIKKVKIFKTDKKE